MTLDDHIRRAVIEQIMCHFAANPSDIATRHGAGADALRDAEPALDELEQDGLITRDDDWIFVTNRGRPFVRAVAAAFDSYLARGAARHSMAV